MKYSTFEGMLQMLDKLIALIIALAILLTSAMNTLG